jgi:hypothetical protein
MGMNRLLAPALLGLALGTAQPADDPAVTPPFRAGETLNYSLKVNVLNAGTASMSVVGIETVRGKPTFHTVFDIKGKVLFKKVENHYESWSDTADLVSLKHIQRVNDGENENKSYDFYPDRRVYVRNGEEKASVAKPVDEGSFIYYLRSIPLEVGKTYTIHRYYNAERNPVIVRVVRRERVKVAAGEFDAFVIQPTIRSRGIFGEEAKAEVWLSADAQRLPLKIRSKLPIGTLQMELKAAPGAK